MILLYHLGETLDVARPFFDFLEIVLKECLPAIVITSQIINLPKIKNKGTFLSSNVLITLFTSQDTQRKTEKTFLPKWR
jgi:hypothetical protein